MNEFIISDTFFGRKGALNKYKRPFKDVDEMNAVMVENWNSVVNDGDIVWHLGNFAWDPIISEKIINQLNGTINLIVGDYDHAIIENSKFYSRINVMEEQIYKHVKFKSIFCHLPLADWPGKKKGSYHFHGHSIKEFQTDLNDMNRVNVCADNWGFKPQLISDLYDLFESYKKILELI